MIRGIRPWLGPRSAHHNRTPIIHPTGTPPQLLMSQNPYAPPNAPLADAPEAPPPLPRPVQVRWAVALLSVSLALSVPSTYLQYLRGPRVLADQVALAVTLMLLVLLAWVYVRIYRGRNWARIVWLVLFVLGVASYFFPEVGVRPGAAERGLKLVSLLLELVALYLLFSKPGTLWFRRPLA